MMWDATRIIKRGEWWESGAVWYDSGDHASYICLRFKRLSDAAHFFGIRLERETSNAL